MKNAATFFYILLVIVLVQAIDLEDALLAAIVFAVVVALL